MSWQPLAAGATVALAFLYLVWKLGFAGRPKKRRRGPDVAASDLVRKRK